MKVDVELTRCVLDITVDDYFSSDCLCLAASSSCCDLKSD